MIDPLRADAGGGAAQVHHASLSVIVPVLNEAAGVAACLGGLQALRAAGHELIVVDGGSRDATVSQATPLADAVIPSPRGRARQMNAGSRRARGEVLLFLHADTWLAPDAGRVILDGLAWHRKGWGRFDVRLSGGHPCLRVVERLMNWRSRLTGIATGDQAIFVRKDWFEAIGGFADIPLMEDIDLSRRLKRLGAPLCLKESVLTSSRRWERRGILRTVLLMWRLRLEYYLGADPARLARCYDSET